MNIRYLIRQDAGMVNIWVLFWTIVMITLTLGLMIEMPLWYGAKEALQSTTDAAATAAVQEIDEVQMLQGNIAFTTDAEDVALQYIGYNLQANKGVLYSAETSVTGYELTLDENNVPTEDTAIGYKVQTLAPGDIDPRTGAIINKPGILVIVQSSPKGILSMAPVIRSYSVAYVAVDMFPVP